MGICQLVPASQPSSKPSSLPSSASQWCPLTADTQTSPTQPIPWLLSLLTVSSLLSCSSISFVLGHLFLSCTSSLTSLLLLLLLLFLTSYLLNISFFLSFLHLFFHSFSKKSLMMIGWQKISTCNMPLPRKWKIQIF